MLYLALQSCCLLDACLARFVVVWSRLFLLPSAKLSAVTSGGPVALLKNRFTSLEWLEFGMLCSSSSHVVLLPRISEMNQRDLFTIVRVYWFPSPIMLAIAKKVAFNRAGCCSNAVSPFFTM
mmetsp:Transcript_1880/g.7002  ORF Transcript_1880/g.7002 Transcript_1880/m.7002 type:complete len:122 (+) Transcript_1880:1036-1401(+)